jgi:hypothetical protein
MLEGLFEKWGIELDSEEGEPYREFLDKVRS